MSEVPVRELLDDQWITRVGRRLADGTFRFTNRPRPLKVPPETDVSWLMGDLGPKEALLEAFQRDDYQPGKDAVRKAQVFWPTGDWNDSVAELMDSRCQGGVVDV